MALKTYRPEEDSIGDGWFDMVGLQKDICVYIIYYWTYICNAEVNFIKIFEKYIFNIVKP